MNLSVCLFDSSLPWELLLQQEGVPFCHRNESVLGDASVVVVNRPVGDSERIIIEDYLSHGGSVLGYAGHLRGICGTECRRESVSYLVGGGDDIFSSLRLVDVEIDAAIPREANSLRTEENTFSTFVGRMGGGNAIILPFDMAQLMFDDRVATRRFYARRDRLPQERVSLVAKGELHRLLHLALEHLHHARDLPYVHAWYFPHGRKNAFAFRIDSDKGSRQEIDSLHAVARDNDVAMSWFLDVKSHEEWLQHFAFLSGQEFGLHCYEHRTYDDVDSNLRNIALARRRMDEASISVTGFSAPFGIWNRALAEAIDNAGFDYSSEFAYAYDSLPLFPVDGGRMFHALQVPIHPVCIGSLRGAGYAADQMKAYYEQVIEEKLLRDEPLFFYHHPTHHHGDVVEHIFQSVKKKGVRNITMGEFARWWRKRVRCHIGVSVNASKLTIDKRTPFDDSLWLRITRPSHEEAVVPMSGTIPLATCEWTVRTSAGSPDDIRRIREFDPRSMLSEVFTALSRKFMERKKQ